MKPQEVEKMENVLWDVYHANEAPHSSSAVISHAMDIFKELLTTLEQYVRESVAKEIEEEVNKPSFENPLQSKYSEIEVAALTLAAKIARGGMEV